jgi:hypothetical protein
MFKRLMKKRVLGYGNLWKFLELDSSIWKNQEIPETSTKEKPPKKNIGQRKKYVCFIMTLSKQNTGYNILFGLLFILELGKVLLLNLYGIKKAMR